MWRFLDFGILELKDLWLLSVDYAGGQLGNSASRNFCREIIQLWTEAVLLCLDFKSNLTQSNVTAFANE